MEADPPPQEVLDHVTVEEHRAQLVLQQAEAHQAANVAEAVQPLRGGAALHRGVEAALARAEKEEKELFECSTVLYRWEMNRKE